MLLVLTDASLVCALFVSSHIISIAHKEPDSFHLSVRTINFQISEKAVCAKINI